MAVPILPTGTKPLPPVAPPDGGVGAFAPAPVNDSAVREALARIEGDGSYQLALENAPPPPQPPAWLRDMLEAIGNFLSALGPLFQALFWVAVIGLVLFLLYLLVPAVRQWVDGLRGKRPEAEEPEKPADWRPDHAAARDLLAEADALAAAGDYGAAVRLLLGRSIEDIDRRRPGVLRPALTSRTIAEAPALPSGARQAFAAMAKAVERAHFALRDLTADEWRMARSAYADFALPTTWSAGP